MDDIQRQYLTVDYDKIYNDTAMLAVTRLLALQIKTNPYMSVKSFLESLSNGDLETLLLISDDTETPHFSELILIAEMLAQAEGIITEHTNEEDIIDLTMRRVQILATFLAIEGLARKDMVKAYRENMSFGEDQGDKLIVDKKNVDK